MGMYGHDETADLEQRSVNDNSEGCVPDGYEYSQNSLTRTVAGAPPIYLLVGLLYWRVTILE